MLTVRHIAIIRKMKARASIEKRGRFLTSSYAVADVKVTQRQLNQLLDSKLVRAVDAPNGSERYELSEKGWHTETENLTNSSHLP
jgi:hypothetical protein